MTRRNFMAAAAAGSLAVSAQTKPNILWITCEDTSPDLGCYGDTYARTPNLDRLAAQGARFDNAFSVYGVCAPSRSSIITGMYPASIGTHHMRSKGVPPSYVRCFSEYLRAAGYYCTNNVKTDYNFDCPVTAWDENSNRAHYRARSKGQPFFSVFNLTVSHESQIRATPEQIARNLRDVPRDRLHDPAQAQLPPYYPDTPIVRRDWANYYDVVSAMDVAAGRLLHELESDGLAENTIVVFFGDHGRGLPRAKRWVYDSGIHVPFLVRWPGSIAPGTVRKDMISFVDLAPTILNVAGLRIPKHFQGQPFLGANLPPPRKYIYAARDRMDETYDLIRAVRDDRFKYIRNYQHGKPYAQYIHYMDQMPTLREWRRLNAEGKLVGPQKNFFAPEKPKEELYDTVADPHEVRNLAADPAHRAVLMRLRAAHERFMRDTKDLGLLPEPELQERMRPGGKWSTTATPEISPSGGRLAGGSKIRISCPTSGASIAWTTDAGEKPGWNLYSSEIQLERNATLRAKACRLGYLDSAESTADFTMG